MAATLIDDFLFYMRVSSGKYLVDFLFLQLYWFNFSKSYFICLNHNHIPVEPQKIKSKSNKIVDTLITTTRTEVESCFELVQWRLSREESRGRNELGDGDTFSISAE